MANFKVIGLEQFKQRVAASNPSNFYINRARRGELDKALKPFDLAYVLISSDEGDDYAKQDKALTLLTSWIAGDLLKRDDQGMLTIGAVLAVQERCSAAGLWSEAVQRWCGVWGQQVVLAADDDRELNSSALKSELIGCGTIRKANGKPIKWNSVLENDLIVKAAKVADRKSGGQSVWRVDAFKRALTENSYTIDRASVIPAATPGMYGQLVKRK